MIDIERIEKGYLRFRTLCDTLLFKATYMSEKENRWEVRCNGRFIFMAEGDGAEKDCKEVAKELNEILQPFIEKQYTKFLDEVIVSKHKLESSN